MGSETLRASDGAVVIVAGSGSGASQQTDASGAELDARFFHALGDPTRVRLLRLLLDAPAGECGVGELIAALGAP